MHTSKEYFKMCDCEEIQKEHGYRQGFYAIDVELAKPYRVRSEGSGSGIGSLQWTGYILGTCLKKSAYFYLANFPPLRYIPEEEWRKFTWLPTQDQIQEMMGNKIEDIFLGKMGNGEFDGLDGFVYFFYENYSMNGLNSMEEIWLAYYMQKYEKEWDGEKWR